MDNLINKFKNFKFYGIYVYAYTDTNNNIKKCCIQPKQEKYINKDIYFEEVYDKITGRYFKPNGISIRTDNLTTIDIDDPEKCSILGKLKQTSNFIVKTRKGYHFYYNYTDKLERNKLCDKVDINTNQLWFAPEYFHNETNEKYTYTIFKDDLKNGLTDIDEHILDWCNVVIASSNIKKVVKELKVKKSNEEIIIQPDLIISKFDIKTMNSIYKILFNYKYFDTYENWYKVAYMGRHLNNTEKSFKLFDKYSRLVSIDGVYKYENNDENINRKYFYGNGNYNINFDENGVLLLLSQLDINKYKKYFQHLYTSKYNDDVINKIDMKFLYEEDDKIFSEWITTPEIKTLCLKSPYGTGKTYAFKKIIEKYDPKRILFITYRQSLAHSFSKDLKERFGFINYLDDVGKLDKPDRVIIQLDSIYRITKKFDKLLQNDTIPFYDLIVLDEIEGLLCHLSFNNIEQYFIHNILYNCLKKCKKILCLDGDMNDRTYDFITTIPNNTYKIYNNIYKGIQKHFIFTKDNKKFDESIDADITSKKKIVIICMSKTQSDRYNLLYKDKYKVILHNSFDKNKEILLDVNENWSKCDILIYSPSVESGVDFNIVNYFYKCYAIITNKSTSYRAFFQMLNRVRYYKDNNILCLMSNNLQWNINDILCRFDEMRLNKWNGIEVNNLTNILIHNDVERFNSSKYFMTCILNTLIHKGHTYEYLNDKPDKLRTESMIDMYKEEIINANDITRYECEFLIEEQRQNKQITKEQQYSIVKHLYKTIFKIDTIDKSFIDKHYEKMNILKNYKQLNITPEERYKINNTDYFKQFNYNKLDGINNILKLIGYTVNKNKINKIDIEKITKYSDIKDEIFTTISSKKFKLLFEMERDIKNNNILKIVGDIIGNYGYEINKETFRKRIKDEKGKSVNSTDYFISIKPLEIIEKYNERSINYNADKCDFIDYTYNALDNAISINETITDDIMVSFE
jgi:hypothetical protein